MRPLGLHVDDESAATLDAEASIDCVQVELQSPDADAEVRGEFLIPACAECGSDDLLLARRQACLSAALGSAIAAKVFAGARSRILPSPRSGPGHRASAMQTTRQGLHISHLTQGRARHVDEMEPDAHRRVDEITPAETLPICRRERRRMVCEKLGPGVSCLVGYTILPAARCGNDAEFIRAATSKVADELKAAGLVLS